MLLEYLILRPSAYIDEQVYFLWDEFDIMVNEKCVQCMLKRVKWSKKLVYLALFIYTMFSHILINCRCNNALQNVIKSSGMHG